jgi:DNA-binding CsgD family transcriptional regulator
MRHYSVIIDENLRHASLFDSLPEHPEDAVIGHEVWWLCDAANTEIVKNNLSRVLSLGESVRYRIKIDTPPTVFFVRAKRVIINSVRFIHCVCSAVPVAIELLTSEDISFIRALLSHEQPKAIALRLGVSAQAVSQHETRLRKLLGCQSRYELMEIAEILLQEQSG